MGPRVFPLLKETESKNLTSDQWAMEVGNTYGSLLGDVMSLVSDLNPRSNNKGPFNEISPQVRGRLMGCGMCLLGYSTAKKSLIERGMTPEQVEAMPVGQVIAIQASHAYQHSAQEFEKLWYMPFTAVQQRRGEIENQLRAEGYLGPGILSKEVIPVASLLLPAIQACRTAQERLARDMAAMQVIEALRMHAASTGKLPASLADVTIVPIPRNPATDQPFDYKLEGETGILDLPSSEGFPGYHRRFEITLRKQTSG